MRLFGRRYLIVRQLVADRIVFAEVFDNEARFRDAYPDICARFPADRFQLLVSLMPDSIPGLIGHPPENLARAAEINGVPVEVLIREQQREASRIGRGGGHFGFLLTKYGYPLSAAGFALAIGFFIGQAEGVQFRGNRAYPWLGLALASAAGMVWCLWRCSYEVPFVLAASAALLYVLMWLSLFAEIFRSFGIWLADLSNYPASWAGVFLAASVVGAWRRGKIERERKACLSSVVVGGPREGEREPAQTRESDLPREWLRKQLSIEAAETQFPGFKNEGAFGPGVSWMEGDQVWSFSSPEDSWRALAGRKGLALVRDGRIVGDYLTVMN